MKYSFVSPPLLSREPWKSIPAHTGPPSLGPPNKSKSANTGNPERNAPNPPFPHLSQSAKLPAQPESPHRVGHSNGASRPESVMAILVALSPSPELSPLRPLFLNANSSRYSSLVCSTDLIASS